VSYSEDERRCRPADVPIRVIPVGASRWRASRWAVLLLSAAGALTAGAASAATFPDLYTITVTVEPGAPESRADVERQAMTRLLTRVTGSRQAPFDPDLRSMLTAIESYRDSFARTLDGDSYVVGFNGNAVERQLRALNKPIWGRERPLTLLWIAIDAGLGERAILPEGEPGSDVSPEMAEMMNAMREQLLAVADERGLPITFPLLDLEDMSALGFGDIWGGFDEHVERASRRYDADAILVGRVWQTELGAEVHWTLLRSGERQFMIGRSGGDGLDWAADIYAADLSTVGGALRDVRLTVLDVTNFRDYARVMRYLEEASLLQSVDVDAFDEDGTLSLRITARGDAGVLERVLSLGGVLTAADGAGVAANGLVFRVAR
jgi:uncharacterized protein